MKISVLIATYNRCETLARTLPTLFRQDFPPQDYEVVVVMDGSSDGTGHYLRSLSAPCRLAVVEQENRGQFGAYNAAVRCSSGEMLLFLDDDCLCEPNVIREHVRAHEGVSGQNIVIGAVLHSEQSPPAPLADLARQVCEADYRRLIRRGPSRRDMMLCANSSVARAAFCSVGGFDERLQRNADIEIGIRLAKLGLGIKFCPSAVVHHLYVKSDRTLVDFDAHWGAKAELAIVRKHPEYKPYSQLSSMGAGPLRVLRRLAACLPFAPDACLRILYDLVKPCRSIGFMRQLGILLWRVRNGCAFYRAAAKAAGSWRALEAEFGRRLPVVLYHRIGEPRPGEYPGLSVRVKDFERQIAWIHGKGYRTIRPSDWLRWCRGGMPLPERPILLTFDDAYEDTAKNAFPVLRRYGFTAAVMVVTSYIGKTNAWDERQGRPRLALMSAEQIRRWSAQGIEFGAHSRSHPDLTEISVEELRGELCGSRDDLSELLGAPVTFLAYPFGLYGETVTEWARSSFDMAFTTEPRVNDLSTDPLRLGRTTFASRDTPFDMWCRLNLGWSPIERLLRRARRASMTAPKNAQ